MTIKLIIFDFDGVVADSEGIANEVLARYATELGVPMTRADSLATFTGRRVGDVAASLEALTGAPIPGFADELLRRTLAAFRAELREVEGLGTFLRDHADIRRCIASSSSLARLAFCLRLLGLESWFEGHVYSADAVANGKPAPDLFLHAAAMEGVDASDVVVIEDSAGGVRAGVAAGMRVIGLLAASHLADGHAERLRSEGASFLARDYREVAAILAGL